MLQQERISLIALCISVSGVLALLFFAQAFEAKEVKIKNIDESLIEWQVRVNAKVVSSSQKDNIAFLQLYDGTGRIKAVIFGPKEEQQKLIAKGSFASFEGKVKLYREELEIVVERVVEWQ